MDIDNVKRKIKIYALKAYKEKVLDNKDEGDFSLVGKFPPLKDILVSLLTKDFSFFVQGVDWVAPMPSTFYVRLKNGMGFYLLHGDKSWVAQVEGKKYYLLNKQKSELASQAISKILRYFVNNEDSSNEDTPDTGGFGGIPEIPDTDES